MLIANIIIHQQESLFKTNMIYFDAFIIAIVEGLTEFIPISSTGHMIIVSGLMEVQIKSLDNFLIFIQLGAILAVCAIYKENLISLIPFLSKRDFKSICMSKKFPSYLHILLAITPVVIVGLLFYSTIKAKLFSPVTVAIGLIVGGIIMIIVEKCCKHYKVTEMEQISYKQTLLIGIGQCFSLWPGVSRSGSTIVSSLLLKINHKAAADFSFFISIPVMFMAVGYDLLKSWHLIHPEEIPIFLFGFAVAFVIAFVSLKWFLKFFNRVKLIPFGIYRIIVGLFTLYLFL